MSSPWTVRPETPADFETVRRITLDAFGNSGEADLIDALRTDPGWLPGLSHVAETPEGEVVAHALLTRCRVGDAPAVALAPCSVLPDWQRRGAGDAVIRSVLDAARAAGERAAIVLGHPPYYPRFGFEPASRFGILAPQEWPEEAFMALSLDPSAGLPSGMVRYAAAFGID
ncbi:N-acetyltransferase [Streptomyces sp. NPDC050617]|uniref:GNAT family N-acetyltransferase n=1 Tax=Streptomyces sp. NPDC050617 TaxID=3154628 RepID=UPI0034290D58